MKRFCKGQSVCFLCSLIIHIIRSRFLKLQYSLNNDWCILRGSALQDLETISMTNNPEKTNASSNFVDNENGHFHFFGQFWTLGSFLAD